MTRDTLTNTSAIVVLIIVFTMFALEFSNRRPNARPDQDHRLLNATSKIAEPASNQVPTVEQMSANAEASLALLKLPPPPGGVSGEVSEAAQATETANEPFTPESAMKGKMGGSASQPRETKSLDTHSAERPIPTAKTEVAVPEAPKQVAPTPSPGSRNLKLPSDKHNKQGTREIKVGLDVASTEIMVQGRVKLRLLEHGTGPDIEIAWPKSSHERTSLFRHLSNCFGMTVAVRDSGERLFGPDTQKGKVWDLNLDRFSGFVRLPSGARIADEQRQVKGIRQRHGMGRHSTVVRLFPRTIDAQLLGGLAKLIGPGYRGAMKIRARYQLHGGSVLISNITVDGHALSGEMRLFGRRGCN